jgi:hypothetical protein
MSRTVLAPGDTLLVTVTVTNVGAHQGALLGTSTCALSFEVYDDATVIGQPLGRTCHLDLGDRVLEPGESISEQLQWDGYTRTAGGAEAVPAGTYAVIGLARVSHGPSAQWQPVDITVVPR